MDQKYKGIAYIVVQAFFFALMSVFVKLAGDLPSVQKSFFRNIVAFVFALILVLRKGKGIQLPRGQNLIVLICRSVCGTIGILGLFYSIDHMTLADSSMIQKLSPFCVLLFSYLFLKEKIRLYQMIAIVIAFGGSLLIIKPGFHNPQIVAALVGVIGAIGSGAAYTSVRYLGNHGVHGPVIIMFFSAFSCIVLLPVMLVDYTPMTLYQTAMLLCAGLCAAGGQFSVTAAYKYAPGREISIYEYTQVVFSALFGFVFFSQIPDQYSLWGYGVILGISILLFFYERRRRQVGL
jgi:drug/metabolite transporter (DMT)-like permease